MKLSLEIIRDRLVNIVNIGFFKSSSDALIFSRPVFCEGESILESDKLYIGEAKDFNRIKQIEKNTACISLGALTKRTADKIDHLLVINEKSSLLSHFKQVNSVFDLFDEWENGLYAAAFISHLRQRYQKMLDISSDIFENGLTIMNNELHIIYQNEINKKYGGYPEPDLPSDDFAIPEDIISAFKYDKEYKRISELKDVFYYEGEMLPHRVLAKNIFRNDHFLFRVIITECLRPLRSTDEALLEYLSQHFIQSLNQLSLQNVAPGDGLSRLLAEALETGKTNRQAIESELKRISWTYTNSYRLASIHVSPDDLFISSLDYYASEASELFPSAIAFPYQDHIVLIINETRSGSLESFSDVLSLFVRENNFRIGISNYSDDFYNLQIMYRQAEMALTIGMSEKPMEWIHWFSRYTLQYIYNMLTENSDLGHLYSPIYYRLEQYDKENGTSYLETLRVYLDCRMNTVQAAKNLFIQRSTMIYRLKRIREITDNELENRDDLLHLYLTFSIIEREHKPT